MLMNPIKNRRILKKALCLFFAFLLSIESLAAVVSDNDGSTFITKAEFEGLKRDFADQITNYNSSIDNKIDGAIASYLAGIKLEKEEDLECLLDKDGYYNEAFYVFWNGRTDTYRIGDDYHYALFDVFFSAVDWKEGTNADKNNDELWGLQSEAKNIHDYISNSTMIPYNVAKLYKVKTSATSYEYRLLYEKVSNHIKFNLFFQFPSMTWGIESRAAEEWWNSGELRNLLELNATRLTQDNLKNNLMTYFRRYYTDKKAVVASVWKQCYATLVQDESDASEIVLHPFSTAREKIWDPENTTEVLEWDTWGAGYPNEMPVIGIPHAVPGYMDISRTPAYHWGVYIPARIALPWQLLTDSVNLKERKLQNLIDADAKNSSASNGLVLGHIPDYNKEMTLIMEGNATTSGTIFVYVGEDAVSNWETTAFKGKKVTVTAGSKFKVQYDDVKKNETVWLMFKNSDSTTNGLVKIETFKIQS